MNTYEDFRINNYCRSILCDLLWEMGYFSTPELCDQMLEKHLPVVRALFDERADATNSLTQEQDLEIYRLVRGQLEELRVS